MANRGLFVASQSGVGAGIDFADPNSPLAKYYLRAGHCLAAGALAAVFLILNFAALWHTDLWAHLRFGDRILQAGSFPVGEPFTPFGDKSLGSFQGPWLSQVIYSWAWKAGAALAGGDEARRFLGGADGLRFLHAFLVTARLGLLFWAFLRLTRLSALAAAGIAVIVIVSLGSLGIARPQVFADLAFAGLLVILSQPVLPKRAIVTGAFLMALWANLHGSFLIGFVFLGAMILGRLINVTREDGISRLVTDLALRRLVLLAAVSILSVSVLNPEGPRIFLSTVEMANHPNVKLMDEWQPLISPMATGAQWTMAACVIVFCLAMIFYRGLFSIDAWIMLAAFGIPTFLHQRGLVWFISVSVWVAMPYFAAALRRTQPSWWGSLPSLRKTIVVVAFAALAFAWSVPVRMLTGAPTPIERSLAEGTPSPYAFALSQRSWAVDPGLREALKKYPGGRFAGNILCTEVLGDFFVWESPDAPVFVYTHVHFFTAEHWATYRRILSAGTDCRALLDAAHINLVVVTAMNNQPLRNRLRADNDWQVLTDESETSSKRDPRWRFFAAIRKQPR